MGTEVGLLYNSACKEAEHLSIYIGPIPGDKQWVASLAQLCQLSDQRLGVKEGVLRETSQKKGDIYVIGRPDKLL